MPVTTKPMSKVRMPCRVCGTASFMWYEPLGFVHVECVPESWFEAFDARQRLGLPPPGTGDAGIAALEPPPF